MTTWAFTITGSDVQLTDYDVQLTACGWTVRRGKPRRLPWRHRLAIAWVLDVRWPLIWLRLQGWHQQAPRSMRAATEARRLTRRGMRLAGGNWWMVAKWKSA